MFLNKDEIQLKVEDGWVFSEDGEKRILYGVIE